MLPDSIAEELALQPGDIIRAVNGQPVTDYLAYRMAIAEECVTLDVVRGEEQALMEIEKEIDDDLGLVFTGDVFDGVRACRNRCIFCFEEQMPPGMRASLRLRDDDYRLSFLHGNFLTLTNLGDADFARIAHEHLSPLFVSVHATDVDVRRRLLQNRTAPDVVTQLRRLAEAGIEVHAQIVLCPGWNDGAVLEQTLADLAALYPTVATVGIVPVGLTAHRHDGPAVRAVTPADAATLLDVVARWQDALLSRLGTRQVFAADEFYLAAGAPLPAAEAYEGFPQKENGIGLARLFLDELADLDLSQVGAPAGPLTIATGALAAPLLDALAARLQQAGLTVEVIPVPNQLYGGGVSVAGLLTGHDLLAALRGRALGRLLLLPAVVVNADGLLLDGLTPHDLEAALGVPVRLCAGPADVLDSLRGHG